MNFVRPAAASVGAAPTTALSIETIDRMTVNEKLAHFSRRDAFKLPKIDGEKVARTRRLSKKGLPKSMTPGSVDVADGHVTRQSYQVNGRPCFGIPTAKLLHGREYKIRLDGSLVFARCGECPVRTTCEFVCDERLHANDAIWEAFREFERRGGRDAYWSGVGGSRAVGSALRELLRHLQAANFTTVADANVAAYYDKKFLQKQKTAAERQRQHRAKVQQGHSTTNPLPSDQIIKGEARLLRDKLCTIQLEEDCPRKLRQMDEVLVERVCVVRAKLSSQGKQHGPTAIAKALAARYPGLTMHALRKRIEAVLKRLPLLQSL